MKSRHCLTPLSVCGGFHAGWRCLAHDADLPQHLQIIVFTPPCCTDGVRKASIVLYMSSTPTCIWAQYFMSFTSKHIKLDPLFHNTWFQSSVGASWSTATSFYGFVNLVLFFFAENVNAALCARVWGTKSSGGLSPETGWVLLASAHEASWPEPPAHRVCVMVSFLLQSTMQPIQEQ